MRIAVSAAVSALVVFMGWNEYDDYVVRRAALVETASREAAPATDWFVVRNLSVADGLSGDSALPVVYDREIKKPFTGRWTAEIKNAETKTTACYGGGSARYEPREALPGAGVDLEWLMQKRCSLSPGQYFVEINYDLFPANYPTKEYRAVSNVFTVK